MNKTLKISLVIPAYNEEAHIGLCLDAVAAQTEMPNEIIVVDNNSTDKTVQIAKRYPFVKLVNESNQGLFHSRATGMNVATGDILGRIDSDTVLAPGWVAEVRKLFRDPAVMAATGPLEYYDMPLKKLSGYVDDKIRKLVTRTGYAFLSGANMAIRRSAWDKIKNLLCSDSDLMEDIDIAIHLVEAGMVPIYDQRMQAAMSARRFEDNPKDFFRYAGGHTRTLARHGQSHYGAALVEAILGTTYLSIKPLHRAFDPALRKLSSQHWREKRRARPDPMRTGD